MARVESLLGSPFVDQAMQLDISTGMIPLQLPQENDIKAPVFGAMFVNEPIFLCYPAGKAKPGDMLGG
jgi:hypothetical protein